MDQAATPDQQHLHLLKDVRFRPVFIVGDHRSGTTLLHRLLAATGCFNYVSAYDVIRYDRILDDHVNGRRAEGMREVMATFEKLGLKTRGIDETPAVPEAPIEYGFILSSASNRRPRLTSQTLPKFNELARKMQFTGDPSKPLLLKNPWDVVTFMDVKRFFPEAKFVFIHRHPAAIMNSQLRAIRQMLGQKMEFAALIAPFYRVMWEKPLQLKIARGMDGPPLRIWERLLGFHTVKAANYFLRNYPNLPAQDCFSIQYEQLCRAPDETMANMLSFLGVQPQTPARYADTIAPREPKILPEIKERFGAIRGKIRPYLELEGYGFDV